MKQKHIIGTIDKRYRDRLLMAMHIELQLPNGAIECSCHGVIWMAGRMTLINRAIGYVSGYKAAIEHYTGEIA
jgi:hypothetical protein